MFSKSVNSRQSRFGILFFLACLLLVAFLSLLLYSVTESTNKSKNSEKDKGKCTRVFFHLTCPCCVDRQLLTNQFLNSVCGIVYFCLDLFLNLSLFLIVQMPHQNWFELKWLLLCDSMCQPYFLFMFLLTVCECTKYHSLYQNIHLN